MDDHIPHRPIADYGSDGYGHGFDTGKHGTPLETDFSVTREFNRRARTGWRSAEKQRGTTGQRAETDPGGRHP